MCPPMALCTKECELVILYKAMYYVGCPYYVLNSVLPGILERIVVVLYGLEHCMLNL